jgi:hypothetical protein
MKKNFIFGILAVLVLLSGCGGDKLENKEQVVVNKGTISSGIIIGKALEPFTFKDQFDKPISLDKTTKKVIFAFTKPTGHIMRVYMGLKKEDYLSKRDILFVADISGMPSIIAKMFAIPDMKESKYSILLIKDGDDESFISSTIKPCSKSDTKALVSSSERAIVPIVLPLISRLPIIFKDDESFISITKNPFSSSVT